jgi:hypothetical protein
MDRTVRPWPWPAGRIDDDAELAEEQAVDLEGRQQFARPVVQQPDGIRARHREGPLLSRHDLRQVAGDHGEQAAGRVGHEAVERGRVHADSEIGGVLEDFVHGGSGRKGTQGGPLRATRATTGCRPARGVFCRR